MSLIHSRELADETAVPWQIDDAVKAWARQFGRVGKVAYHKLMRCHCIYLSLSPDDPRLQAYKEGKVKHMPYDLVPLHRQLVPGGPLVGIPLEELGETGVVELLDEANLWSGRGEYADLNEAVQASMRRNEEKKAFMKQQIELVGAETAWLHRREVFDVPFSAGGLDTTGAADSAPPPKGTDP